MVFLIILILCTIMLIWLVYAVYNIRTTTVIMERTINVIIKNSRNTDEAIKEIQQFLKEQK